MFSKKWRWWLFPLTSRFGLMMAEKVNPAIIHARLTLIFGNKSVGVSIVRRLSKHVAEPITDPRPEQFVNWTDLTERNELNGVT